MLIYLENEKQNTLYQWNYKMKNLKNMITGLLHHNILKQVVNVS